VWALVAKDLRADDRSSAVWDAAEAVPVAGEVVMAGHLSLEAGSSNVAAEHGKFVADTYSTALKWVGVSNAHAEQAAFIAGGVATATSAVTVAPYIAAHRKLQEGSDAIGKWIMKK
jgi:hypothetical protein